MADPAYAINPASGIITVTPSDTTVLSSVRALYVGGAGDVAVTMQDGSTGTLPNATAGSILPVQCIKVMATGTTATNIRALT
jgi:ethanolamine utilization microcompartment shell protein EutS